MKYGIIFDMDGTLYDTGEGIRASARYALEKLGLPPLPDETLNLFIGPSLFYSFNVTVGLPEETALKAVSIYRERYASKDVYLSHPYDGVEQMLDSLHESGYALGIASSKPLVMVRELLKKYGYEKYFCRVIAPDSLHKSSDKTEMINMAKTGDLNLMVGDTVFDIDGAHGAGLKALIVTYGYGVADTIKHADAFAESTREVLSIVKTRKDLFA